VGYGVVGKKRLGVGDKVWNISVFFSVQYNCDKIYHGKCELLYFTIEETEDI